MQNGVGACLEFPHVLPVHKVGIGELQGREAHTTFRFNLQTEALAITQHKFAQVLATAGALGLDISFGHFSHRGGIATQQHAVAAVAIVFPRTEGIVVHIVQRRVDGTHKACAAQFIVLWIEGGLYVKHSLRVQCVDDGCAT